MVNEFRKGHIPWNKGIHKRTSDKNGFKKGNIPWNKGKKITGWGNWNKGKVRSEENKRKISLANKGKKAWNKGINQWKDKKHPMMGKHQNEEVRKKISIALKGKKRKPHSEETRNKIGLANKGKKRTEEERKRISLNSIGKHNGEKNANWKGGISRKQDIIRSMKEYKEWRSKIFERDNWTCQTCRKRGCYLEPHHIKRMIDIINEYNIKITSDAISCKELWDISNGVTLCLDCHKLTRKRKKYIQKL